MGYTVFSQMSQRSWVPPKRLAAGLVAPLEESLALESAMMVVGSVLGTLRVKAGNAAVTARKRNAERHNGED